MCRALGGVGANIRATFVTASFANALARAVERTAADMDARSVAATMRGATKVKALRDGLRGLRGEGSIEESIEERGEESIEERGEGSIEERGEGSIEERGEDTSTDTSSSGAWRSLTLAWAREAPRASARDASDALAALAKLPEARDAMSPNAWTATARVVERTASSCKAPHARDAACLFAAHPGAVAAAAARRDALWPAIVAAVDANVRDMNADAVARVLDAIGRSADARDALTANPAAALRLAKAFERVARPNVGDADNVATTLFTVLGWNGDEDEGEGEGSARTEPGANVFARRGPSRTYAYGPGDVGNVIFALARVGGGGSERISETAIGASGWGATLSDALRDAAARAHLRPAGLARAFLGLGAHEGLRRHVSDETWDALAGAFARVAARRDASAAETARIVVAVGKLPGGCGSSDGTRVARRRGRARDEDGTHASRSRRGGGGGGGGDAGDGGARVARAQRRDEGRGDARDHPRDGKPRDERESGGDRDGDGAGGEDVGTRHGRDGGRGHVRRGLS